ncbi:MAG: transcriptional regulator [Nitrosomonadales bacterium]|nr:transcriptional regulator [Nitrosomonadales bacterium]
MALKKFRRELLVIIAEATLEKMLTEDVKRLGAHGYTVTDVRGSGSTGVREGIWEADRTIRMEILCESAVANEIATEVMSRYASHYGISLFFSEVDVLRPEKY